MVFPIYIDYLNFLRFQLGYFFGYGMLLDVYIYTIINLQVRLIKYMPIIFFLILKLKVIHVIL
ncbi:hypothetical protein GLOIN_2v1613427 [Rhizophagus irregularis DAOM 181602=DAOM 197198]|uniref:Uncharacterized protein n=1 Tax=Rhizophagus irregularis (strain DAOM 181602 / DAOM 197198 / MUCL 43194) TaxID=747089 RepID=A0A2P4PZH4_RHIID|nr:hypothetical protein GLOIN_2v1613427 [Rhizophagus irregularis DAOM 181602=DAOM 197198]POG70794.1 hypothetical protein GLOIN_2v1613427 [Rhizophagus irregularis DAOM 181602=DAOM 197198]|eukprot:XP_025177660.1 hypothetical protein GLOIN_2v1613427 [Rhizophagus irregularis DAOM 181602=DAOM 197198]